MNIVLHNIRSIVKAELNGGGITLVLGPNTSGKTSLLNSVGAAFLGDAKIYGATKADASTVVREGEKTASVRVSSGVQENGEDTPETWGRGLIWPGGTPAEHGVAPPADEITMGRVDPAADFDKKQWADFIRKICGPDAAVKWPDVEKALTSTAIISPKVQVLEVKEALKTAGWDGTATMCKTRAADARRAWEKATGERFGSDKAHGWQHSCFQEPDDAEALEAEITKAEAELARAKAAGDIATESKDELEAEIAGYQSQIKDLKADFLKIQIERSNIDKQLAKFPRGDQLVCPCCDRSLSFVSGKLEVAVQYDAKERASLADGADKASKALSEKQGFLGSAQAKLEMAQSMLKKVANGGVQSGNTDTLQIELENLENRLDAQRATKAATEHFDAWSFWTHAADVTGPLGVRFKATKLAVAKLQPKLDAIAQKIFPEHKVELRAEEDGLGLYFDGYDYKSMVWDADPNSYKLGIQVMFQILHAEQLSPDAPILIDRADTLDRRRLNGVLNILKDTKRQAIIAKTVDAKPEVDALAKHGVGKTFYINNGTVEAV